MYRNMFISATVLYVGEVWIEVSRSRFIDPNPNFLSVFEQVCSVVFGYLLMVCFKWSPHTENYLKAMALPVWAVLLFYIGE